MFFTKLGNWFQPRSGFQVRQPARKVRRGFRPQILELEPRILLNGVSLIPGDASGLTKPDATTQARLADAYGHVPLSFEVNQGQTDSRVDFLSRGQGYNLFLTSQGAVLSLKNASTQAFDVLRMNFSGANSSSLAEGLDGLVGKSNYYVGSDPQQWHTDIPTFGKVVYHDVYPGIDVVYYGNQQQLEYDFVVAPGADPNAIVLDFQGADQMTLNDQGALVLHTAGGDVLEQAPNVYQQVNGVRTLISGSYNILNDHQVAINLGAYDKSEPLVIDPSLVYSTYLGANLQDFVTSIVVDSAGNAYVTGGTSSPSFPVTAGSFQPQYGGNGSDDAFLTKYNPAATQLLYSTYLGGSGADDGFGVALDSNSNIYVAGSTQSINFPTTVGAFQRFLPGVSAAFVSKFSTSGSIIYSTYIGSPNSDRALALAVDVIGQAYITGSTNSAAFPVTTGVLQSSYGGGPSDAFVAVLNSAASNLVFSTYLGGSGADEGRALVIDGTNNVYIAGKTDSPNLPSSPIQAALGGAADAFVAKMNGAGTSLIYFTYLGGTTNDQANGIAIDSNTDVYVTGSTDSPNFPVTAGVFQSQLLGGADVFAARINPSGQSLTYSTYIGGINDDVGNAISVDTFSNATIVGRSNSFNYPTTSNRLQGLAGQNDVIISELNSGGSALLYSTFLGGTGNDNARTVTTDAQGTIWFGGDTTGFFPITPGVQQPVYGGGFTDGFVGKLTGLPIPSFHLFISQQPGTTLGGAPITPFPTVQVLDRNNNVVTGDNSDQITAVIGQNPGSGTLSGTLVLTVTNGVAVFNNLTIDKLGNGYTLVFSNPALTPVTTNPFNILQATQIKFAQQPTNTTALQPITPAVTVQVLDQNGNLVTSDNTDQITLAIGTNPGNPPGKLGGTLTLTVVNGVATFSNLTIDQAAIGYTLSATSGSLTGDTSSTFDITGQPQVATQLAFGQQPTTTLAGKPITPSVMVQVQDKTGAVVTTDNTTVVTIALGNNPPSATLSGTLTATAVNGIATFSNLSLDKGGTGFTLTATAGSLTPATSNAFDITTPLPGVALAFAQQPTSTGAGVAIIPPIKVAVLDNTGAVVTTDNTDVISIAIGNNPNGGTLSGTTTATVSNGIATFSNLSINRSGLGYTLIAASTGLNGATSSAFDVLVGPVTTFTIQAPATIRGGIPFAFTITAFDQFGSINTSYKGTVAFNSSDPLAQLPSNYTFTSADKGVHTFTATLKTVGSQGITVTDTTKPTVTATAVVQVMSAKIFSNIATGTSEGGGPEVKVIDPVSKAALLDFFAYDPQFAGGVRVALGDVNGDGSLDLVTAPGPGGGPDIHVYDVATGALIRQFFAFDPAFTRGEFVATGDVNADGFDDIVVSADSGGGPNVVVYSGKDNSLLYNFFAFDPRFIGGVRVAAGDVNGDGLADIVTAAGPGGGPNVRIFSGANGNRIQSYFAYDPRFVLGVFVATGNFTSDPYHTVDVVTGPGNGGGPNVIVFDGPTGKVKRNFFAEPFGNFPFLPDQKQSLSGVRVASVDVNGDGVSDLVVSYGKNHSSQVVTFDVTTLKQLDSFFAYNPLFTDGVFVGGGSR